MDEDIHKKIVSMASVNKDKQPKLIGLRVVYLDGQEEELKCTGYGALVDFPDMLFAGGIDGDVSISVTINMKLIRKFYITEA